MAAAKAAARGSVRRLRLTLLGVGTMSAPRYAPAGLLIRWGPVRVAIDGRPGAEPPGTLDAWLVTDEHAELRAALRRLAHKYGLAGPAITDYAAPGLRVRPYPVEHTSHRACGYQISAGCRIAVWAPEFWRFPDWADGADLMFAEAAAWDRPIRFRGGAGGHAPVTQVAAEAARRGIGRLGYAHICAAGAAGDGRWVAPVVRRMGSRGRTYNLPNLPGRP